MSLLRAIWQKTVWAKGGVRAADWRFRGIFRFVLPVTDVFFLWFGASGWWSGVRSVQEATSDSWQTYWSGGLAIAAFVALVGISFPRLWLVEMIGKIPLIALVSVYITLFIIRAFTEDPEVAPLAGLICILILLPVWRVGDLGYAAWLRKRLTT